MRRSFAKLHSSPFSVHLDIKQFHCKSSTRSECATASALINSSKNKGSWLIVRHVTNIPNCDDISRVQRGSTLPIDKIRFAKSFVCRLSFYLPRFSVIVPELLGIVSKLGRTDIRLAYSCLACTAPKCDLSRMSKIAHTHCVK